VKYYTQVGRDSSVGIETAFRLDGPEIEFRWRARISAPVHTAPGANPASYTTCTGTFPEIKRLESSVDHSPPYRVEVKKKSRAIHLFPIWAFEACSRMEFTFSI
jgi:hypothetical protein